MRMSRMPAGSRPFAGSSSTSSFGVADQRGGDPEPLAHPEGVAADAIARAIEQADLVERLVHAAPRRAAIERGEHAQVLAAGEVRVEGRRLDEAGDAAERRDAALRGRGRTASPPRRPGGSGRASSAASSSSPRRSDRGSRRRRPRSRSGRRRSPPRSSRSTFAVPGPRPASSPGQRSGSAVASGELVSRDEHRSQSRAGSTPGREGAFRRTRAFHGRKASREIILRRRMPVVHAEAEGIRDDRRDNRVSGA